MTAAKDRAIPARAKQPAYVLRVVDRGHDAAPAAGWRDVYLLEGGGDAGHTCRMYATNTLAHEADRLAEWFVSHGVPVEREGPPGAGPPPPTQTAAETPSLFAGID